MTVALTASAGSPVDRAAHRRWVGWGLLLAMLLGLLILGFLTAVAMGSQSFSWSQILEALRHGGLWDAAEPSAEATIIWNLRLPRAVLAVLVGANLAVSGVLLQGVMRNPLAAPDIIGVTAGAGLAATLVIVAAPSLLPEASGILALPISAFVGAMLVAGVVFLLSWQPGTGTSPVRMILAGVAVSSMIGGIQGFLMIYFSDRIQGVVLWLAGSLNTRSWHHVAIVVPCTLLGSVVAVLLSRPLDLLQLGEETTESLGVSTNRARTLAILAASLLTGSAVCACGAIGFVGLVVPHIVRLLIGHVHARLIPAVALTGAVMVLWADVAARLLREVPVGVITALVGGPYFVVLLYRKKML